MAAPRATRSATAHAELDHIVVTAPLLAQGVAWVEAELSVPVQPGGKHPRMGTHNALLRLGPSVYLEVIAIDPDADPPDRPRWFGLDDLAPDAAPRLATWVVRTSRIEAAVEACPEPLGEILAMERGLFAWRITVRDDGTLPADGVVPSVIEWSSAPPAGALDDRGCRLVRLEGYHAQPDRIARALAALGVEDVVIHPLAPDERPGLTAFLDTPSGPRWLGARPPSR